MADNFHEKEDFEGKFNGNVLRRIFQVALPHKRLLILFLFFTLISSVMDTLQIYLNKLTIDNAVIPGDKDKVLYYIGLYGISVIIQAIGVFSLIYFADMLSERVWYDLRQKMFDHLQKLSLSYYSVTPVGWIMSRVNSDSLKIADLVSWGLVDSSFAFVNILLSGGFMLAINWRLALIVFTIVPVMLYVAWQFRKRILKEYRIARKLNSKVTGAFNENITGVRVVKALQREDENLKEFNDLTHPMFQSSFKAARLNAMFLPSIQILSSVGLGLIIWASDWQIQSGWITIGGIQAFVNYLTSIMWPVQDLARVYGEMQQSVASGERIFSLLDTQPTIVDKADAFTPDTICGEIEFDHVSFYYDDGDGTPVLTDFSLKVKQGETIALVGSTGGGKSTIVNLMARFQEPKKGTIKVCGRDYRDYKMESIQSRIGMVLQTPHLFSGTIRENIRYGKLEASDMEIEQAAVQAGADEFIRTLSKQYDEQVGESGNLLSFGQKQLISLARAILADPEIFIMDEATSSVDTLTEYMIQKGMETMMKGRTSFIIAHRLSTIKRADRILVIEDGKIAEEGSHTDLLRKKGKYYRLYTQQFRQQKAKDLNIPL